MKMKIERVETFTPRVALGKERFYSSQAAFPERNSLLVKITTESGAVGWGEGGQYGPPEPVAACIQQVLAPQIIGLNPCQPVKIWEMLYANTRDFGQKGAYIEAISAIDIALWDLWGQALGVPVCELMGGAFRTRVKAYATGCYYRGEDVLNYQAMLPTLMEEARSYVDAGFNILKVKIGLLSIEEDMQRVRAIREAVGDGTTLLVDANHAYNAATAIRAGRGLEAYGVRWFEEPVPPEDRDGYRLVRQSVNIPIAGGEAEYTRYGFRDLIGGGCVDIAQPDVCVAGGFSEWQKIHAIASSYNTAVIPHVWGSGIALAAALHVLAAIPLFPFTANPIPLQNEPVVEFDRNRNPLRDDLLENTFALDDGYLSVPQAPGLGIKVNEDILSHYCRTH